jgi:hypothetical protein
METEITFMWKTVTSNVGDCPALYKAEGGYVVQGKAVGPATRAQLRELSDDEAAVWVNADVIDRIREDR